jgi:hypothetical protein
LASLLTLAGVTLLGAAARAQAPEDDLLDQVRKQQQVAAQKIEADVKGVLQESIAGARTDPARTADVLRFFLKQIGDTPGLSSEKRASLQRQVQARISQVDEMVRRRPAAQDNAVKAETNRPRFQPPPEERNPAVSGSYKAAMERYQSANKQINSSSGYKKERDRGVTGALNSVVASSAPVDRDVTFSKDWAKTLAKRPIGPKLTDREKELVRALNSVMSVDFKSAKFREVIEYIAEKTGQTIILDKDSMREAMVEYDTPVTTGRLEKVTVRTILKKILADNGLGFIVKDGSLQVVSEQKARNTLSTRVYPVSDVVVPTNPFNTPLMTNLVMNQNAALLIALIQTTIEPSSWQVNGGPGTIYFHAPSMSLVVRQTSEFHLTHGLSIGQR